ncbi:hypothetical protein GWI33_010481 [Rhynchophorus ferrugineus]|uniref:Uncharacterized protein n=1 Tax=Rhynchophorus ferrugineus TaxID=354439 RepID=A0A834MKD6_RHYFE|nr:hypothetical protein GWI33_010481 [Rhynchophorus ferrugineus]
MQLIFYFLGRRVDEKKRSTKYRDARLCSRNPSEGPEEEEEEEGGGGSCGGAFDVRAAPASYWNYVE